MQVTLQPLQILSRLAAVFVVALPIAALRLAVDDYERQTIRDMSHQELIAFVKEVHAGSFLGAYVLAAILTLILVAAVEGVALLIRLTVGLFCAQEPTHKGEKEFLDAEGMGGVWCQP
jgi:hypothetical protein